MPNLVIINPFTGRIQTTKGSVRFEPTRAPEVKRAATGGVIIDPQAATRTEAEKAFQKERDLILGSVTFDKRLKPRQKSVGRIIKEARAEARQTGKNELTLIRQKTEAAFVKKGMKKPLVLFTKNVRKAVKKLPEAKRVSTSLIQQARQEQQLARKFFPADVPKKTIKLAATIAVVGIAGGVARGVISGGLSVVQTIRNPIKAGKEIASAARHPVRTIKALGKEFAVDPAKVITEFIIFSKVMGLGGKAVKRSPVGRFVQEEVFIRTQPKEIRPAVRSIVKASKVQEKLNPAKTKSLKKVDFVEVKSLTPLEAAAIKQTLKQTDSVVFGSAASRATAGRFKSRLPKPKDVDIATKSVSDFSKKFISNLPKSTRKNYLIRNQKVVRRNTRQSLFDIKPLSRLVPDRSILTRRGFLPVSGYVTRITRKKGSILPRLKKKAVVGAFEVPTGKIVKVKGIKVVGFGEQTVRKGLGTLQVLIEKNLRRAKDPKAFIIGLEVQIAALRRARPKTTLGRLRNKRRIRILSDAVRLLKSAAFAKLLERKVPGIIKQFPLVAKINTKRLKKVKATEVRKAVKQKVARLIKKKKIPAKRVKRKPSKLPKRRVSRLPSKLPRRKVSRVPSRIPVSKVFKAPSKLPIVPSMIPISKIPSRLPKRLRPSRLPSRVPSRLPSKLPKKAISKLPKIMKKKLLAEKKFKKALERKKKELVKLTDKVIVTRKLFYIPDLYSRVFGIKANPKERRAFLRAGRVFTGIEARKLLR